MILDVLARHRAHATFFVVEHRFEGERASRPDAAAWWPRATNSWIHYLPHAELAAGAVLAGGRSICGCPGAPPPARSVSSARITRGRSTIHAPFAGRHHCGRDRRGKLRGFFPPTRLFGCPSNRTSFCCASNHSALTPARRPRVCRGKSGLQKKYKHGAVSRADWGRWYASLHSAPPSFSAVSWHCARGVSR